MSSVLWLLVWSYHIFLPGRLQVLCTRDYWGYMHFIFLVLKIFPSLFSKGFCLHKYSDKRMIWYMKCGIVVNLHAQSKNAEDNMLYNVWCDPYGNPNVRTADGRYWQNCATPANIAGFMGIIELELLFQLSSHELMMHSLEEIQHTFFSWNVWIVVW